MLNSVNIDVASIKRDTVKVGDVVFTTNPEEYENDGRFLFANGQDNPYKGPLYYDHSINYTNEAPKVIFNGVTYGASIIGYDPYYARLIAKIYYNSAWYILTLHLDLTVINSSKYTGSGYANCFETYNGTWILCGYNNGIIYVSKSTNLGATWSNYSFNVTSTVGQVDTYSVFAVGYNTKLSTWQIFMYRNSDTNYFVGILSGDITSSSASLTWETVSDNSNYVYNGYRYKLRAPDGNIIVAHIGKNSTSSGYGCIKLFAKINGSLKTAYKSNFSSYGVYVGSNTGDTICLLSYDSSSMSVTTMKLDYTTLAFSNVGTQTVTNLYTFKYSNESCYHSIFSYDKIPYMFTLHATDYSTYRTYYKYFISKMRTDSNGYIIGIDTSTTIEIRDLSSSYGSNMTLCTTANCGYAGDYFIKNKAICRLFNSNGTIAKISNTVSAVGLALYMRANKDETLNGIPTSVISSDDKIATTYTNRYSSAGTYAYEKVKA